MVGAGEERRYWLVFSGVLTLLVLPVLLVRFPPLCDYPNHLARVFILSHLDAVPAFREAYAARWLPYPNLAMDLVLVPLVRVLDAPAAGRLFLVALPILFLFGADRLARAVHGRLSWSVPLVGYLFFTSFYFYGFVNYVFGVGLYFLSLAAWLRCYRSPSWPRYAGVWLLAIACYLTHKTAFGFLATSIFVRLVLDWRRLSPRTLLLHASVLVPSALIELFGGVPHVSGPMEWDGIAGKAKGLGMLVLTYDPLLDVTLALIFAGAVIVLARRCTERDKPSLVLAAALFALYLALPSRAVRTGVLDRRLLVPVVALALLGLRVGCSSLRARVACGAALAAVCLRSFIVITTWPALSADLEQRLALLDAVPSGASVFGFAVQEAGSKATFTRDISLRYLHTYAAIERLAAVNGLFAGDNQQPIRERHHLAAAESLMLGDAPLERVDWAPIFSSYDYLFAVKLARGYGDFLRGCCTLVRESGDAALFRGCRLPASTAGAMGDP